MTRTVTLTKHPFNDSLETRASTGTLTVGFTVTSDGVTWS